MGGQLYSAFVFLLNIKRSLHVLTDCVTLSHSSAMKSYHFDPQHVTKIMVPFKHSACVYSLNLLYHWMKRSSSCRSALYLWHPVLKTWSWDRLPCPNFSWLSSVTRDTFKVSPHLYVHILFHLLFTDHCIIQYCILFLLLIALLNK